MLQVPLHELPGVLAKCSAATQGSDPATVRQGDIDGGFEFCRLDDSHLNEGQYTQVSGGCCKVSDCPQFITPAANVGAADTCTRLKQAAQLWADVQLNAAASAAKQVPHASLESVRRFAIRLQAENIAEDHPLAAFSGLAIRNLILQQQADQSAFLGMIAPAPGRSDQVSCEGFVAPFLEQLQLLDYKAIAKVTKELAWAGLVSPSAVESLCSLAIMSMEHKPNLGLTKAADAALQFALAGDFPSPSRHLSPISDVSLCVHCVHGHVHVQNAQASGHAHH